MNELLEGGHIVVAVLVAAQAIAEQTETGAAANDALATSTTTVAVISTGRRQHHRLVPQQVVDEGLVERGGGRLEGNDDGAHSIATITAAKLFRQRGQLNRGRLQSLTFLPTVILGGEGGGGNCQVQLQ